MELKIAAALKPSHLPHSTRETAKDLNPAEQVETVRELAVNRCQEAIQAWRDRGFTMEQVAHNCGVSLRTIQRANRRKPIGLTSKQKILRAAANFQKNKL